MPRSVRALVLLNIQVGAWCGAVGKGVCLWSRGAGLPSSGPCWQGPTAGSLWTRSGGASPWPAPCTACGHVRVPAHLPTRSLPARPTPQSYGGGRDIVGLGDNTLLRGQEFKQAPIFDDGRIEVGAHRLRAPSCRAAGCAGAGAGASAVSCLASTKRNLGQTALQVVGFGSGWHAALTMAQASGAVAAAVCSSACRGCLASGRAHLHPAAQPCRVRCSTAHAGQQQAARNAAGAVSRGGAAARGAGAGEAAALAPSCSSAAVGGSGKAGCPL